MSTTPTIVLNSGASIPVLGLGTFQAKEGECKAAVLAALTAGYRHIDGAAIYQNESEVGQAIEEFLQATPSVKRSDLFITSKLWNSFHAKDDIPGAIAKTLADLKLEYLDLYLIHWPVNCGKTDLMVPLAKSDPQPTLAETWEGMIEHVYNKKLARSIGVSNFSIEKLKQIEHLGVLPAVNQVESHPYFRQEKLFQYCQSKGINLTAYAPLGSPGSESFLGANVHTVLQEPLVAELAAKYKKSTGQILIRWAIQRGWTVIPKSTNPGRIAENFNVFDFSIDAEDFQKLSSIPRQIRMFTGQRFLRADAVFTTTQELFDE
eukprot:PhF_6_TR31759/c0_g1_i1/m.46757/K00002/AKR1A1, adh; alcohol dehydrogenase (NADP+)